jgi:hypothetical protein
MPVHPFRLTQPTLRFSINGNFDFDRALALIDPQASAVDGAGDWPTYSLGPLALSSAASVELDQLDVTSNTHWE